MTTSGPLDIIVQTSTVELFESYGVAVAPVSTPPGALRLSSRSGASSLISSPPDGLSQSAGDTGAVALIEFNGKDLDGILSLSMSLGIAEATGRPVGGDAFQVVDWVRELTNQLMGRIKSRLARVGVVITASIPVSTPSATMRRRRANDGDKLKYDFRALRGRVSVSLAGRLSGISVDYAKALSTPDEGDVILF